MRENESGVVALPIGGCVVAGVTFARTSHRGSDSGGMLMDESALLNEAIKRERASGVVARLLRLTAGDGGGVKSCSEGALP